MPKQKTIPELKAEIAANERSLPNSNTKSSSLKTASTTTKKENGTSGRIILSPVAQPLKAWLRS